jgi:hypothetical protein
VSAIDIVTVYNTVVLPLYVVWRLVSRAAYLVSGWWLWKRVLGMETGKPDAVSKGLRR